MDHQAEQPGAQGPPGPRTILVVEDEAAIATAVAARLRSEGFRVEVAQEGHAAVELCRRLRPDLVVLDLLLPGLDGLEVCRRIQADQPVPVLMLTARDDETDLLVGLAVGADDYMTKPFSFIVLVARLRALIRRGAPERPVVLEAGDLRLDPNRHRVHRGDHEVDLTPREFDLLHYLLRHKGAVVTKSQILESVWDPAYEGDVNVVEVYIGYLRRKIDVPFGRQAIQTARGAGYRLSDDGG
jgi:DNA-binding response OmpR family regulator